MHGVRQFWTLTRLTALEAVRQPVCLLLAMTGVLATALTPLLMMFNFGEDGRLARDGGLAFHLLFGLFIAGHAAASALSREIRSGTASAVLSKPVDRAVFFLAKFGGVCAVLLAFSILMAASTLLAVRTSEAFVLTGRRTGYILDWRTGVLLALATPAACLAAAVRNYWRRRPFTSGAFAALLACVGMVFAYTFLFDRNGIWVPLHPELQWRILPASLLVTLALLVLAAFTVSLSTRLGTLPTLLLTGAVLFLGLLADHLMETGATPGFKLELARALVPNWQHFWMSDALGNGGVIPWGYVARAALYAGLYAAGILMLGLMSFRHAEMR